MRQGGVWVAGGWRVAWLLIAGFGCGGSEPSASTVQEALNGTSTKVHVDLVKSLSSGRCLSRRAGAIVMDPCEGAEQVWHLLAPAPPPEPEQSFFGPMARRYVLRVDGTNDDCVGRFEGHVVMAHCARISGVETSSTEVLWSVIPNGRGHMYAAATTQHGMRMCLEDPGSSRGKVKHPALVPCDSGKLSQQFR